MGDDSKPAGNGAEETGRPPVGGDEPPPALRVIAAFGGIRPMANKLNVPVSTVQGWKERGVIPETRHEEIRAAATAHAVTLDDAVLDASAEAPPEPAEPQEPTTGAGSPARPDSEAQTQAAAKTSSTSDKRGPADAESAPPADADEAPNVESVIAAASLQRSPDQAAASGGRSGWLPGFVLGALVFAVGAGGAVLTKDLWAPGDETAGSGGSADGGDSELSERLATLEGRLAELETQPAGGGELPDNLATVDDLARLEGEIKAMSGSGDAATKLSTQMTEIESRLASLGDNASAGAEAAVALSGLSGEVATIEASLDELRATVEELQARNAGQEAMLWSALSNLRDALRYAGPFDQELADVSRLAGNRAEFQAALEELKPLADGGVASLNELQREFPSTARDIVAASYDDSEDGMLGDVLSRVSQVVTVRPVGDIEGDDPGAIVARAESHVGRGDLEAALEELKGLPENAGRAADGWRERAERRIAADAAIQRLNGMLAEHLAAGG